MWLDVTRRRKNQASNSQGSEIDAPEHWVALATVEQIFSISARSRSRAGYAWQLVSDRMLVYAGHETQSLRHFSRGQIGNLSAIKHKGNLLPVDPRLVFEKNETANMVFFAHSLEVT